MTTIFYPGGNARNTVIDLPASKSISNRALIIRAISGHNFPIHNLSEADDTQQLLRVLTENNEETDAGEGGTTLRFLLAYYCLSGKAITLTAAEPMRKRPIATLVSSLRELGAKIEYIESEGKLPVKIHPGLLNGKKIIIPGDISSQFISAMMLIGPAIKGGLVIEISGEILSLPYILMTKSVMEHFGAEVSFASQVVIIAEGKYTNSEFTIEPDWSAASYWYEILALKGGEILLNGLTSKSLQGDREIANMMEHLGVTTEFISEGAKLRRKENFQLPEYFTADFTGCPDLGPAVATTCAALNITADLKGLKNFRLKESDRAAALQRELYNMNVKTDFCGGSKFKLYSGTGMRNYTHPIKTYRDHRIAMAFAPLAIKTGSVMLDDSSVVSKSYPNYFDDLVNAGFVVK